MTHYHVAAAILLDGAGRVLIAERLCDGPLDGLWEFPGGKIGPGETASDALCRELGEELGIAVTESELFMQLHHDYPDRSVALEFFVVSAWQGDPEGLEGQQIRWVHIAELDAAELLPANAPVVEQLIGARANGLLIEGSKAQRSEP